MIPEVRGPAVLAVAAVLGACVVPAARAGFPEDPAVCAVRPPPAAEPADGLVPAPPEAARDAADRVSVRLEPDRDVAVIQWTAVTADPLSEELAFVVGEGAVGFAAFADEPGEARWVAIELFGPDGTLLACEECPDAPVVGEVRPGRGTVQVPDTDRPGGELVPGEYVLRVRTRPVEEEEGAFAGPSLTVSVELRTERDLPVAVDRTIDLNFVYLPGCGLDIAYAMTSPEFASWIEGIDKWLHEIDLRLGTVTHVELDAPEFSMVGTWEEAGRLMRLSRDVGRERALNVFCLEGFDEPLYPAVGLSGGIPGPVANGTRDSGIALRTEPFPRCAPVGPDGYTCHHAYLSLMIHEIGHYLGFYHTTETDLEHADPFEDTPRCAEPDLRVCPDWTYAMFPVIHSNNHRWSPHQVEVARTHPLLRVVPRVGDAPAPAVAGAGDDTAGSAGNARPLAATVGPNPFDGSVRIAWSPPGERAGARVGIWDVTGRRVRSLAASGRSVAWDGTDEAGRPIPAGVYFVRIETTGGRETLRVVKAR